MPPHGPRYPARRPARHRQAPPHRLGFRSKIVQRRVCTPNPLRRRVVSRLALPQIRSSRLRGGGSSALASAPRTHECDRRSIDRHPPPTSAAPIRRANGGLALALRQNSFLEEDGGGSALPKCCPVRSRFEQFQTSCDAFGGPGPESNEKGRRTRETGSKGPPPPELQWTAGQNSGRNHGTSGGAPV